MLRSRIAVLTAVLLILGAGAAALVIRPAIAPVQPPDPAGFRNSVVARGAELAAIGDCAVCHTAPDGPPYAGGRALTTPFGTIYASNITPEPATGIGRWSLPAFRRAMRFGIDRTGRHLYPALPYPHFTRATDDDIAAVYAFLMTREPTHAATPPNRLPFPFNIRAILAGWNLMFLHPGPWQPDPGRGAMWNRGAYLVEGLGHCGACHTPHNALGAEQTQQALGGGVADGWYAPPLDAASLMRLAWTKDELADYLRAGIERHHGVAAGPMNAVTQELSQVPDADVRAIAAYIAAGMPAAPPARARDTGGADNAVFDGACGSCHANDAPMMRAGAPPLALSSALAAPTPRNAIQVILQGIPFREGAAAPYMPAYAAVLTDAQVADIVRFLRARYSDGPAWTNLDDWVRRLRRSAGDT